MKFATLCIVVVLLGSPAPIGAVPPLRKKLIEYGWDVPDQAFVRQNIRKMEQRPFDGVIFALTGWPKSSEVFTRTKWDDAKFGPVFRDCANIQWDKFTDNFIALLAASDMDWFSDADWEAVRHNVGIVAKAAALARCRGLCFDPEPYGNSPWEYRGQPHAHEKSFAEYQAIVRQRGAEFMQAIAAYLPKGVIHTFFQVSIFGEAIDDPEGARREQFMARHPYGLLPAFLNGMLDAAPPEVVITDGNETAYTYTEPLKYYEAYHRIRQRALAVVAPENLPKYEQQVRVGQALYVDYVFGLGLWAQRSPALKLQAAERQRWFEQNAYYALRTADEFVWLYSEKMNWWKNVDLPPGLEEAVRSARTKAANGQPLGFEISDTVKGAAKQLRMEQAAGLQRRTADIRHIAVGGASPVIDGKLDDPAWQSTAPLEPFLPYVSVRGPATALTQARVTYDDQNLFVAVQCAEPKANAMKVVGTEHDDNIWEGDSVDIFLSQGEAPTPYVHFIINPKNVQWDEMHINRDDMGYNPKWTSAVQVTDAGWTVEVAVPWEEMNVKTPAAGELHRANLCRERVPGSEETCWSQTIGGFLESENFGTWIFH